MITIPARWYHEGRLKAVRLIVIHCTVSPESSTGAEGVAAYFKAGTRKASAHRVCDNNSTVQCVKDEDTAYAAAGANSDGIHLELVGYPQQSEAEWLDGFGRAMLTEAGATVREWAREFHIPPRWLTVDQVADGRTAGLCTHADVSKAFPDVSTGHWDPGPNFPKHVALATWFPTDEETEMIIVTCPGKPSRLLAPPTCAVIDGATVNNLKAAGIKTVAYEADDYARLLEHIEEALGRP